MIVSKKDAEVSPAERELVHRYLKIDDSVVRLADQFLDKMLEVEFHSDDDRESALAEFKDRCSRRYHNFYPPVAPGEELPPAGFKPE